MASLVTEQDVKNRAWVATGVTAPPGMTDAILLTYIEGATARILRAAALTAVPAAGLQLDELKELCKQLVIFQLRVDFFGLSGEAMSAQSKPLEAALRALEDAVRNKAPNAGVQAKVVGGSRT